MSTKKRPTTKVSILPLVGDEPISIEVPIFDTFVLYGQTWHITPRVRPDSRRSRYYEVTHAASGLRLPHVNEDTVDEARKAGKRLLMSKGRAFVEEVACDLAEARNLAEESI